MRSATRTGTPPPSRQPAPGAAVLDAVMDGALVRPRVGWEDVAPAVDRVLGDWVSEAREKAPSRSLEILWERIGEGLVGGKRLRPQLLFHAYAAFGGRDAAACATLGAALELLHGALVVHDDVI